MKKEDLTPRAKKFIELLDRQSKANEEADYYTLYPNINYRKSKMFEAKSDKAQEMLERLVGKLNDSEKESIELYLSVPIFEDWL